MQTFSGAILDQPSFLPSGFTLWPCDCVSPVGQDHQWRREAALRGVARANKALLPTPRKAACRNCESAAVMLPYRIVEAMDSPKSLGLPSTPRSARRKTSSGGRTSACSTSVNLVRGADKDGRAHVKIRAGEIHFGGVAWIGQKCDEGGKLLIPADPLLIGFCSPLAILAFSCWERWTRDLPGVRLTTPLFHGMTPLCFPR